MTKLTYTLVAWLVLVIISPTCEFSSIEGCNFLNTGVIDCTQRNLTYINREEIKKWNASSVLDFGHNFLKLSSFDVANLRDYQYNSSVVKILLNNNNIKKFPNLCDTLPNLEEIDLRFNHIAQVNSNKFKCYKYLKVVRLESNPINDTELKILKTEFPNITFTSLEDNSIGVETSTHEIINESTSNYTVSANPVEDSVAASNTTEGNAKNSVSKESPTTNSNSLSTNPVEDNVTISNITEKNANSSISNTTEENAKISVSEESLTTNNNSLSTNPVEGNVTISNITEGNAKKTVSKGSPTTNSSSHSKNSNRRLIFVVGVGLGVVVVILAAIFFEYKKRTNPTIILSEMESREALMYK